jgi:hypothetical protein
MTTRFQHGLKSAQRNDQSYFQGELMAQFMLLLHEHPADFANVTMEEIQAIIEEYTAWRDQIAAAGRFVASHKLQDEGGRHLKLHDDQLRVVDGPYAEAKEVMGGYYIVSSADYDEAVEVSKSCPHLKYGGWIELRQIDEMHAD